MPLTAFINLTHSDINVQPTDPELIRRWLGGRGLGAYLLYCHVGPEVEAFSPDNFLIFTSGIMNGTSWPTASRYHVTFKSPATDAYGYANSGGFFGPELRRAGFDALVITGKAPVPVFIRVIDRDIQILSASHLWGQTTSHVEEILVAEAGGRVASIGLAGENQVLMAAIINDKGRAAARSGPGAVMGSKNLKAVQVVAGTPSLKTEADFRQLAKQTSRRLIESPDTQGLMNGSTLFLMTIKNKSGDLPAKNHQFGQVPFINTLDVDTFSKYWTRRKGCAVCPIRCARNSELVDGSETIKIEGPEYETTDSFGPMCWNPDPEVVIRANALCNDHGLDTISTGVTIAFAMECHENGLLNDEEFSLEWGDPNTILGLIQRIAERQGLGKLLAEGTLRAAQEIGNGAEKFAMQVKGVEMPRQEPRIAKAFGLGHATSNRGADHLYALPTIDLAAHWEAARKIFPEDVLPSLMDIADETYKADVVMYGENFCAIIDSLGLCKFSTAETYVVMPDDLAEGLKTMGYDFSGDELLTIGERIVNLERLYNRRHGFNSRQDVLPARFTKEPLPIYSFSPGSKDGDLVASEDPVVVGQIFDFEAMMQRYYKLRGWDENGLPTTQTLERLGIAQLAGKK
ncbi:MAG: aldehyde ferredoxin oxidoreductase family protein [Anaerolineales bacterium]|nr:aldehyde ferredoxin oxidoreductase family protein [Anaerolineales bacterium]